MTGFVIGVVCLVTLAGWMLRPAWRTSPALAGRRRSAHLGILGEQLAKLDKDLAAGQLDAAEHRAARSELQRRVLDETATDDAATGDATMDPARSPKTQGLVGLAVALLAIALYAAVGNPAGLGVQPSPAAAQAALNGEPAPEVTPEALQAMLASLAQRLEKPSDNPANDLQGWTMLARSYATLQRFADADRAYARAIALAPSDAQLLADRADVLAVLQGQRTAGQPERLIAEALRIDPQNLKALALAGSAAFERQDFAAARGYWQQARERAPDGTAFAAGLDRSLAAAREAGGDATTAAAAPTAPAAPARITGRVSLAPTLAARAVPTDTVFVFARAAQGSRMPLAIIRRNVADLPFDFTLDDSLAMSPQTKLSGASQVVVGVRVSRSGNAIAQAGDLYGESAVAGASGLGLRLLIDRVQPP